MLFNWSDGVIDICTRGCSPMQIRGATFYVHLSPHRQEVASLLAIQSGILLSCRTLTASGLDELFGICSHIGSTSGPSRSPAPSQPQHHTAKCKRVIHIYQNRQRGLQLTIFRPRSKLQRLTFLLGEQPIMRTIPGPILWICSRVVR